MESSTTVTNVIPIEIEKDMRILNKSIIDKLTLRYSELYFYRGAILRLKLNYFILYFSRPPATINFIIELKK